MGVAHDALPKSQTGSKSVQVCVCVSLSSKAGCLVQATLHFDREYWTEPPSSSLTSKSKHPSEALDDVKDAV